jgi:predicted Fe-Mo cluster-binding NifX family protein
MDSTLHDSTVAFAVWNDRIAPMFDVARQVYVVHIKSGQVLSAKTRSIESHQPIQKVLRLIEVGVGTLVCGDISRQLYATVEAYGIRVVSSIGGDVSKVLQAWLSCRLEGKEYATPARARQREKSPLVPEYHRQRKKAVRDKH